MRPTLLIALVLILLLASTGTTLHAVPSSSPPPVHVWFEPEWFEGVEGSFAYWVGPAASKPTGHWGIAGPGISAEWTQGGESEWNSMGVPAVETSASCVRDFVVPRAGAYKVWVRYVDHRQRTEPFNVRIIQDGKTVVSGTLGLTPVVPPNDEYELYWGFSFGWGSVDGSLGAGPAQLELAVDQPGEAWRQLDAVLITDDLQYTPVGRMKPPFGYLRTMAHEPPSGTVCRGTFPASRVGASWARRPMGGREFSMWTNIDSTSPWWNEQALASLPLYDVFFQFSPPADIADKFREHFAGRRDLPFISWADLLPGLYLGVTPDLSPEKPVRQWLERTKTPFFIMTNYANPQYNTTNGPATYQALTGPLAEQFLGYIHGEAIGVLGTRVDTEAQGKSRREYVDAWGRRLFEQRVKRWSEIYKTPVVEQHAFKGIACLSVDSTALAHLFLEMGADVAAYEEDATNVHVPMRIAFMRGAARQYGKAWINYASGNFGDACNYFSQKPVVARGAPGWFHSKYAITDGVSACWYRKLYYLNYLGGASAVFWEQGLANQWILPGPGTHPIQLSPFGRGTEEFQAFVDRLPDRGEPCTPVAILLSYGNAYDRVNYSCKMLHVFRENISDIELRELFNVCWYPSGVVEGMPAAPDLQSMPSGRFGNIFDVLVDRPSRTEAIMDYPVLWAAGDVELGGAWRDALEKYLKAGGTLVVNIEAARDLPAKWLGVKPGKTVAVCETWNPAGEDSIATTPFEVADVGLKGAQVMVQAGEGLPLITRHQVGAGAVILTLAPRMLGQDERAHPSLSYLMNCVTSGLLPVEVRLANGERPQGEIMYQVNKTKDGYLVMLVNNRGVDKTQSGVARVDRRESADVVIRTSLPVKSAREYTQPRDLTVQATGGGTDIAVRVHPGDVQVVCLVTR